MERGHENLALVGAALALQGLQGGCDHAFELLPGPAGFSVEQGHPVGVPGGHRVRPDVLDVGHQEVAILIPSNLRAEK